jgi:hypothetical protein
MVHWYNILLSSSFAILHPPHHAHLPAVMPAQAGIQGKKIMYPIADAKGRLFGLKALWIPAFAGMTEKGQP